MNFKNKRYIPRITLINRNKTKTITRTMNTRNISISTRSPIRRPIKKALIIGINYNTYPISQLRLRGCVNDANNMKNFIQSYCGYSPSNIRLLTDDTTMKPTKQNIENSIKWLVQGAQKGDTLLFHYSGHGTYIFNNSRIIDETDYYDEAIVPLDFYYENNSFKNIIIDDWLFNNLISKIPKDVTLWSFVDCCNSGTVMDMKYNYKSLTKFKNGSDSIIQGMSYNPNEWTDEYTLSIENLRDVTGNIVNFSASKDIELSEDVFVNGSFQGAFTSCLLQTLQRQLVTKRNIAQNSTVIIFPANKLTLKELLKEVNCRLDINGFDIQNSEMSVSKNTMFENNGYINI